MSFMLELEDLKKHYALTGGILRRKVGAVKAVDGVSLTVEKGETFGLVGESGCGKTTLAKTTLRLLNPNSGNIFLDVPDEVKERIRTLQKEKRGGFELRRLRAQWDLAVFKGRKLRDMRRKMQMVYQDPTRSLNPRMLVKDVLLEPLAVQNIAKGNAGLKKVSEMLQRVGLNDRHLYRYPHEFSGGQRQRIAIARALITTPRLVFLDEPTSSVDVSVRAQLLNLFQGLRKDFDLTYVYISHDLSVVECIADRVAVMYLGKIVELARTSELYERPLHPYSIALFSAIPVPDPTLKRKRVMLTGEVPSPVNPPSGCRFHPRCDSAMQVCQTQEPKLIDVGNEHMVACHLFNK
ncbi:MAG: oligopeptide/dipeptide ABC transporter ATP-binding protein [Candidatus Bathyarchaeia archaeon]